MDQCKISKARTHLQNCRCFASLTTRGCLLGRRQPSHRRFFLKADLLYKEKHLSQQNAFLSFLNEWRRRGLISCFSSPSPSKDSETCIIMLQGPGLWHQLHFVLRSSSSTASWIWASSNLPCFEFELSSSLAPSVKSSISITPSSIDCWVHSALGLKLSGVVSFCLKYLMRMSGHVNLVLG